MDVSIEDDFFCCTKSKMFEVTLPPGAYLLGDLCYSLRKDLYDKIFVPWRGRNGVYETNEGGVFAFASTAHGDGLYADNNGVKFPVDAGNIGLVDVLIARRFLRGELRNGPIHYLESDRTIQFGFDYGVIWVQWFDGEQCLRKEIDTDAYAETDTDVSLLEI